MLFVKVLAKMFDIVGDVMFLCTVQGEVVSVIRINDTCRLSFEENDLIVKVS